MLYRVVSHGVDVEFTQNIKSAEEAYKDAATAELWQVEHGNAVLMRKKIAKLAVFAETAKYKN